MQAVQELGQERNTFVLVTSDRRYFWDVVVVVTTDRHSRVRSQPRRPALFL
eukprot:COSAG01_NODE_1419_length_10368_cov_131.656344_8_plen_51_part_00